MICCYSFFVYIVVDGQGLKARNAPPKDPNIAAKPSATPELSIVIYVTSGITKISTSPPMHIVLVHACHNLSRDMRITLNKGVF